MTELNRPSNPEREEVQDERFSGERIVIDGKHFEDCSFDTCTLIYRGGVPPHFVRCDFAAPRFVFEEAAQSTVQLMSAICTTTASMSESSRRPSTKSETDSATSRRSFSGARRAVPECVQGVLFLVGTEHLRCAQHFAPTAVADRRSSSPPATVLNVKRVQETDCTPGMRIGDARSSSISRETVEGREPEGRSAGRSCQM